MSKVSIIVPIYNVEKYIEKCLNSLVNQTFKDIEILAISDGSPDNSGKIVKRYARKDKRIKYIEKENGGYGSVLEFAINMIDSTYFMICDPDDWLEENAVEVLVKTITKNKVDLVIGGKYLVYSDNSEKEYSDSKNPTVDDDTTDGTVYNKLYKLYYLDPSPHSKIYKTKLCKGIKLPYKVNFTDLLLYMYALESSTKVMYIKDALSNYLVDRPGNSVTTYKDKMFYDHYVVMKELLDYASKYNDKAMYSRVYIQLRYVLNALKTNGNNSAKTKYLNEYWNIYKELIKNKHSIYEYYPKKSFVSKLKCRMLLSGLFEKTIIKKMMGAN